jgi:dTDP-glucose 4,6-dehydratase
VVPNFMCQALKGEEITVYGDGSQTRSFCYVDDLVEGLTRLLWSDEVYPVNLGNPSEMTIQDFAVKIRDLAGTNSKIVYRELPVDDPKVRQPDISKARRVLNNWEPKVDLDTGLARTIEFFQKKLASAA